MNATKHKGFGVRNSLDKGGLIVFGLFCSSPHYLRHTEVKNEQKERFNLSERMGYGLENEFAKRS